MDTRTDTSATEALKSPDAAHDHVFPKRKIVEIHGLRGLAALLVFVFHLYEMAHIWKFLPEALEPYGPLFISGRHGVELFFVISGYLIIASLLRHQSAGRFLLDRAIRIYPVFLVIHCIVFFAGPIIGYKWMAGISAGEWALHFVSNALFLPGIFDLPIAQLSAWSLSYEALFYLICAAAFVAMRHFPRNYVLFVVALISALIFVAHPKAIYFLIGVAGYALIDKMPQRVMRWCAIISIPLFFATMTTLTLAEQWTPWILIGAAPAFLLFTTLLRGEGPMSSFLRLPWLQYFGTISYSFYLWSALVTYPLKLIAERFLIGQISNVTIFIGFCIGGFALSWVTSHMSYLVLEEGARKLFNRWRAARTKATAAAWSAATDGSQSSQGR